MFAFITRIQYFAALDACFTMLSIEKQK